MNRNNKGCEGTKVGMIRLNVQDLLFFLIIVALQQPKNVAFSSAVFILIMTKMYFVPSLKVII